MIDEVNGMTPYDRFVRNIILYISSCTKCSIYKIYIYEIDTGFSLNFLKLKTDNEFFLTSVVSCQKVAYFVLPYVIGHCIKLLMCCKRVDSKNLSHNPAMLQHH